MKKFVSSLLAVSTAFMLLAMPVNTNETSFTATRIVSAATNSGWIQSGSKWYYKENGTYVKGWKQINKKWYYFDSTGAMVTGWKGISGKWYYFDKANGEMATSWKQIGGTYYYFEANGIMVTGWKQMGGAYYYFDANGAMAKGWKQIGGVYYYFDTNGAMKTGWLQLSGKWYYLNSNGAMFTGWQKIGKDWYYFASNGAMKTGWLQLSGKWYYLNSNGSMKTGWSLISDDWYYFYSNGVMATSSVIDGCTINANGVWKSILSETTVYNTMIALKGAYPEGMRWTNDDYYQWKGGVFIGGYGCAGFAFILSDAAFGDLPARVVVDKDNIRVGDILRINGNTHSVIVLAVDGDIITIAEGNYNSSIHWGRTLNRNTMLYDYTLTRYPD